jgi:hypothetical protein
MCHAVCGAASLLPPQPLQQYVRERRAPDTRALPQTCRRHNGVCVGATPARRRGRRVVQGGAGAGGGRRLRSAETRAPVAAALRGAACCCRLPPAMPCHAPFISHAPCAAAPAAESRAREGLEAPTRSRTPARRRIGTRSRAAHLGSHTAVQLYSRTRSRSSMAYKMCSLWRPRRLLIVTLFIVIYGGNFLEHVYVGIEV